MSALLFSTRARLFDAALQARPAVFAAAVRRIDSTCMAVRGAAFAHYQKIAFTPSTSHAARADTVLQRTVARITQTQPEFTNYAQSFVAQYLANPDLQTLSALDDALDRFCRMRTLAAADILLAGAQQIMHAARETPETHAFVRRLHSHALYRFAIDYTERKMRLPAMADAPFALLTINGSELLLQYLHYGALAHLERFVWTIPFSLIFSPMANALVAQVARVTTHASANADAADHSLSASLAAKNLTSLHRKKLWRHLWRIVFGRAALGKCANDLSHALRDRYVATR